MTTKDLNLAVDPATSPCHAFPDAAKIALAHEARAFYFLTSGCAFHASNRTLAQVCVSGMEHHQRGHTAGW